MEKIIKRKILKYLNSIDNCHAFSVMQGLYSQGGISDIICCYEGLFIAFEVKTKTGKVSKKQECFLQHIKKAHGLGYLVRSVEETQDIIINLIKKS